MISPYSSREIIETAGRMLARYRTPAIAQEMAHAHAMDYADEDPRREYWTRVHAILGELTKENS